MNRLGHRNHCFRVERTRSILHGWTIIDLCTTFMSLKCTWRDFTISFICVEMAVHHGLAQLSVVVLRPLPLVLSALFEMLQLDVKLRGGVPLSVLDKALEVAQKGRKKVVVEKRLRKPLGCCPTLHYLHIISDSFFFFFRSNESATQFCDSDVWSQPLLCLVQKMIARMVTPSYKWPTRAYYIVAILQACYFMRRLRFVFLLFALSSC